MRRVGLDADDAPQGGPGVGRVDRRERGRIANGATAPVLDAAMPLVSRSSRPRDRPGGGSCRRPDRHRRSSRGTRSCRVGWLSFKASTYSACWSTTWVAMAGWQPIASIVTLAPSRASRPHERRARGELVRLRVGGDLTDKPGHARLPRALTSCSASLPCRRACDRRTSGHRSPRPCSPISPMTDCTHVRKQRRNASGSSRRNTPPPEGVMRGDPAWQRPETSAARRSSSARTSRWATHSSAPQITPHNAIVMMSPSRCAFDRSTPWIAQRREVVADTCARSLHHPALRPRQP